MKLEKAIQLSSLFDIYGTLLTFRQQQVFKCYYFDDISLGEIADILGITKQAVKDCLDKAEKILLDYENKLKIGQKLELEQQVLSGNKALQEKIKKIWKES